MRKVLILAVALAFALGLAGCGGSGAPKAKSWNSGQAVEVFKKAGLECENTRAMTKDDYGMAPMLAKEGTRFFIPSLGEGSGGRIFSFDKVEDLEKTKEYYESFAKQSAVFFSWLFTKDNILVQINGDLKEEKAKQYQAALENLK